MHEVDEKLTDFIQTAIDLANSVRDDVQDMRHISDETIILLSQFKAKHDELSTHLDIANEVQ